MVESDKKKMANIETSIKLDKITGNIIFLAVVNSKDIFNHEDTKKQFFDLYTKSTDLHFDEVLGNMQKMFHRIRISDHDEKGKYHIKDE